MEELFVCLERQLKELIAQHHQLRHSHQQLNQGKELLLAKQQKAITQIQNLVSKLKSIEIPS